VKRAKLVLVQMRDVFQADLLRHGDEAVHAHVGHGFVRALHGGGVKFHPAGVGQFDEAAGRAASRSRSALLSFSPSASHSAETASQSMPLPLTTSRGLSWRGVRNSR
jgi:hypothetical protein